MVGRRFRAERQSAERGHRRTEPADRGHRRGRAVQGPVEPPERDQADAEGDLREDHEAVQQQRARDDLVAEGTEDGHVREDHDDHAQRHRLLPQPGRPLLQLEQQPPSLDEPGHRPTGQPEQPQFLGRLRVNGEPVRVVGVPLGRADLGGVAVLPDSALPQQPVGRRPGQHQHDGRPPGEAGQHDGRGHPAHRADQTGRDEVEVEIHRRSGHPAVELTRGGQVVGQFGILEVADAGRIDTAVDQAFVEPGRQQIAEVHADRGQDRADDQHQHEDHADEGQGRGEPVAGLDGADRQAGRHREDGGQRTAEHQQDPPGGGEPGVGPGKRGEELPLLPGPQPFDHAKDSATARPTVGVERSGINHLGRRSPVPVGSGVHRIPTG